VRPAIDLGDGGLVHHRQPDIAVGVELEVEAAFRLLGPHHRDRNVLGRSALRVHDAHELGAEIGVPNLPILIDDDVVGKRALARQIVFRDEDFGGPALGARERLERIFDRLGIAEAHAGEKFRGRFGGIAGDRRALPARARQQRLRMRRRAARRVTRHSQKYLLEFGGVVVRGQHALERVAAHAHREKRLLLVGAGKAEQPLPVGELRYQALDFAELEIGRGGVAGGDVDRLGAIELVADGADRDRIFARLHARGREAVAALLVGHHRGGDGRAFLLGADQHALHRALFARGHQPGQGGLRLRAARHQCGCEQGDRHSKPTLPSSHG
jgi:hypothetical protein